MDSEAFVEAVRRHVWDAAIEDTVANLKSPPGRRVSAQERARSDWYKGLSAEESAHVYGVIDAAVHAALFGLFAVLDGDRTIDEAKGRFELVYVGDQRVLLNDPDLNGLHDLLNASN